VSSFSGDSDLVGLLVTCLGLPGSGKSTLCSRVSQILRQRGIPCELSDDVAYRNYCNKLLWVFRAAGSDPRNAFLCVRRIIATRQRSTLDLVKMIVNWLCRSFLLRQGGEAGRVRLFDEGLYQALWSIALGAQRQDWAVNLPLLQPVSPGPGLTVVVETSLETVQRRLAARPGCESRLEKWLPDDPQILFKAARAMEVVTDLVQVHAQRRDDMRVLLIDADRDDALEANALKVAQYIQALLRGTGLSEACGELIPMRRSSASVSADSVIDPQSAIRPGSASAAVANAPRPREMNV
jgi:uncharacterized protein YgfB (UPF0149 family)